jgi:membrane-associated phospholipid phosphatase/serine/threonine-protein kinase RIO1
MTEDAAGGDRPDDPVGTPRVPEGLSLEDIELGERVSAQLTGIGERREVRVAGIRVAGRRRRPAGAKAPLPRELRAAGRFWLVIAVSSGLLWWTLFAYPETREWWQARDLTINRWFVDLRNDATTSFMKGVHALGSAWLFRPLRIATVLALIAVKRWRHLFGALIVIVSVQWIVAGLAEGIGRPRPFVEILGDWQGYSHPSAPAASLSATLAVMAYSLIPKGVWRRRWMALTGVLVTLLVVARVYLGVDQLTDAVVGVLFGISIAVVVFRLFVPDAVFPVVYKSGSTAHLDIGGRRGEAIRSAVSDQLGMEVLEMKHFGLEGSGGSTPILLTVAGDPDAHLFAKLYSTNHLRADRWYKVGRTILYGGLEDEVRFASVRRLVEYEDYLLLRFKRAEVPSAEPFGFVEITPEREYLIVTEFLQDAEEITTAEVDDDIIDDALLMIRRLWDAGLAHRDVKPANVLVKDGKIRLIDVAFGTVRPTPWRQSVDLANMMIILALRTDSTRVYERALRFFAPGDIAEAFAATRSVTVPSQTRSSLKLLKRNAGVDVIEQFKALAPHRDPIAIQRWGARRIWLTVGAALGITMLASLLWQNLTSGILV